MTKKDQNQLSLNRRQFVAGAAASMAALEIIIPASDAKAAGYPDKPITVVVMYGQGGGTDTVMRTLATAMAKAKGWTINVINKPGAVGAVATKFVAGKSSDGYTILGGANYNKFVRVMGHAEFVPWEEWVFFQAASSLASWSVPVSSPFKTFEDVVAAAKKNPGKVSISTSGIGGLWQELALIVADAADIKLKYVGYKGGKAATLAGLQGETDIAGGGVHEHVDLIRAGKLRNLQQTGSEDIKIEGVGTLRSIGNILPKLKPILPVGGTYNFIMKRDTPPEVLSQVKAAFEEAVKSPAFQETAKKKYFQIDVRSGEAADKRGAQLETITTATFNKYAGQIGKKVKSAKDLNLPTPDGFEAWWPPKGYKAPKI